MAESRIPVLIVGATGNLGSLITRECLKRPELLVHTLVLNESKDKCLCEDVRNAGGSCWCTDLRSETIIKDWPQIHTIISAVCGEDETVVEGQTRLLKEASQHGVKRFIPSDFMCDLSSCSKGESFLIDQRLRFRECLEKSNIKPLCFSHGLFMESYFWAVNKWGFSYWGDINQKIDLTAEEDVARVVAAAVCRENLTGNVTVSGCEMSTGQIVEIYNKITGKNWQPKCLGTLDELKTKIKEFKKGQDEFMAVQCGMMLPVFDGRGKIKNNMKNEFPEVKFTTLEEFIQKIQSKGLQYHFTIPDLVIQHASDIKAQ